MSTEQTWLLKLYQTMRSFFLGVVLGFSLIAIGTLALWYNEGTYIKTNDAIIEAQGKVVEIPDITLVDTSLDGKLVHATGPAVTEDTLTDSMFGISTVAIKLKTKVTYYQWKETKHTKTVKDSDGDDTTEITYTYAKAWTSKPIDSSKFYNSSLRKANKILIKVEEEELLAENVTFGAYTLPFFLKNAITGDSSIKANIADEKKNEINRRFTDDDINYIHTSGEIIYLGRDSTNPAIGDVQISFSKIEPTEISIIARVSGNTFEPFAAASDTDFHLLVMGAASADAMLTKAKSDNTFMAWLTRIFCVLLIIGGFRLGFRQISALTRPIPLLGHVINTGVWLAATGLGLIWSFLAMSITWLYFRPAIGITLVVAALGLLAFLIVRGRRQNCG